ncbi:50S ribosomal protein L21 [Spiroplasma sp. TIUS-1]|nr:50S ribosomal protein L21 [Spiroplasma sp. TIUS-1]
MFAIIKTGGKQLMVSEKDVIYVEKLDAKDGQKVYFTEVIMIDDKIGDPMIKSAVVVGKVLKQGKGKKIRVIRYHPKKNINKVYGHRQPYTKVEIESISINGSGITVPTIKEHIHETHAKTPVKKTAAVKAASAVKKPASVKAEPKKVEAKIAAKSVSVKPAAKPAPAVKKPAAKPVEVKKAAPKKPAAKPAVKKAPAKK